jgi:hypothetical protein
MEHTVIIVRRPADQVRPICSCAWQGTTCRNLADATAEGETHKEENMNCTDCNCGTSLHGADCDKSDAFEGDVVMTFGVFEVIDSPGTFRVRPIFDGWAPLPYRVEFSLQTFEDEAAAEAYCAKMNGEGQTVASLDPVDGMDVPELEARLAWLREHPYANGTEGEADWIVDRIDELKSMAAEREAEDVPNPVVMTALADDGGTIRFYRNGMVDAVDGATYSVSPGFESLEAFELWLHRQTRTDRPTKADIAAGYAPGEAQAVADRLARG